MSDALRRAAERFRGVYQDATGNLPDSKLWRVFDAFIAPLVQEQERLCEWQTSVSNAVQQIPEFHTGEWAGDKTGWGFHFEVINWLQRKRSELQAAVHELEELVSTTESRANERGRRIHELEAELKLWKPLTDEEAERAYAAAEAVPISREEIDRIVERVTDPTYRPTEPEHVLLTAKVRQLQRALETALGHMHRAAMVAHDRHGYVMLLECALRSCVTAAGEDFGTSNAFARLNQIDELALAALAARTGGAMTHVFLLRSDLSGEDGPYTIGAFELQDGQGAEFALAAKQIMDLLRDKAEYDDEELLTTLEGLGYRRVATPQELTIRQ